MENRGEMKSTGETPDSSTRALWQPYQQSHLGVKHEELAKEVMNLALTNYLCSYFEEFFNMP
jgi:hypothetical protein